jgi:hypothetical protein
MGADGAGNNRRLTPTRLRRVESFQNQRTWFCRFVGIEHDARRAQILVRFFLTSENRWCCWQAIASSRVAVIAVKSYGYPDFSDCAAVQIPI